VARDAGVRRVAEGAPDPEAAVRGAGDEPGGGPDRRMAADPRAEHRAVGDHRREQALLELRGRVSIDGEARARVDLEAVGDRAVDRRERPECQPHRQGAGARRVRAEAQPAGRLGDAHRERRHAAERGERLVREAGRLVGCGGGARRGVGGDGLERAQPREVARLERRVREVFVVRVRHVTASMMSAHPPRDNGTGRRGGGLGGPRRADEESAIYYAKLDKTEAPAPSATLRRSRVMPGETSELAVAAERSTSPRGRTTAWVTRAGCRRGYLNPSARHDDVVDHPALEGIGRAVLRVEPEPHLDRLAGERRERDRATVGPHEG
jgi:hypothetical protein